MCRHRMVPHKTIDGQGRLVRFAYLQTDNFRLCLRQQTDKRQKFGLNDEQTVNTLRKIA